MVDADREAIASGPTPPTDWSLVQGFGADSDVGRAKLSRLIETYRPAVYRFYRTKGYAPAVADDLTQGFWTAVVEGRALAGADPKRGRFRTYLATVAEGHAIDEYRRLHADKRGGRRPHVGGDFADTELRHLAEDGPEADPELALRRELAHVLCHQVTALLTAEYAAKGKADQVPLLLPFLDEDACRDDYAPLMRAFDIDYVAARKRASRFRTRWKRHATLEAARMCGSLEEGKAELGELLAEISGGRWGAG